MDEAKEPHVPTSDRPAGLSSARRELDETSAEAINPTKRCPKRRKPIRRIPTQLEYTLRQQPTRS